MILPQEGRRIQGQWGFGSSRKGINAKCKLKIAKVKSNYHIKDLLTKPTLQKLLLDLKSPDRSQQSLHSRNDLLMPLAVPSEYLF